MWPEARIAVAAFLLLMFATGCTMTPSPQPTSPEPIGFLALGDSYTIGEGVDASGRWTEQVAAGLRAQGIPVLAPVTIARTGWTTDELDAAIDAGPPARAFGLVSVLIGVNNQYRGREVDEFRAQFRALLQRAIGFAGNDPGRVLVLSIPDWGATPFGAASGRDLAEVSREIDAYNRAKREVCAELDVAWVDITPVSRSLGSAVDMVAEDGLHPSEAMYRAWAAQALPAARALLATR